jgi:tripartite-type tricarboxylate transporter receptor subunit TctC
MRLLFVAATMLATSAIAQDAAWPTRPLRLVAGFAAGGNSDTSARLFAAEMGKRLGQVIVVDNRLGAGGTLASTLVAKAAPDGYTLLWATGAHPATAALYSNLQYDTMKSFSYVSTGIEFPLVIAVRADSPYRTLNDLISNAKGASRKVSYSSPGLGTTVHLTIEYLESLTGTSMLHIPYKGGTASVVGMMAGEANMVIASPLDIVPQAQTGRMRALAVTTKRRYAKLPDTPTVDEAGVKGFDVGTWNGLVAPAGTPPGVIKRLALEMQRAAQLPEVKQTVERIGSEAIACTPEELTHRVEVELKRWTTIVRTRNIKQQ